MADEEVPSAENMMWNVLKALRDLGGEAPMKDIDLRAVEMAGYSESLQSVMHKGSQSETEIAYRLKWARTKLKNCELIVNPSRGIWALTNAGWTAKSEEEVLQLHKSNKTNTDGQNGAIVDFTSVDDFEIEAEVQWKDALLKRTRELTPTAFEHLTKRLLVKIGFKDVRVTGKSGDKGLDGVASLPMLLLSFPVYFQCKRYEGSVGAGEVRDFRGAMAGRGEKGLLVTTGAFTSGAVEEANRDGAPPVELVSGDRLAELMKEHGLGVDVVSRQVEEVSLDESFFQSFS